jgi:hypothetical protein
MDKEELFAAMRYGSPERSSDNALGRFGLGLKTASTSVCRKLTVVTRKSKKERAHAACWDLDLVAREQKWVLQIGEASADYLGELEEYVDDSGTMVCWDVVDRLGLHEDIDEDGITASALGAYMRRLREHLELVFHRFIQTERLTIHLNGEELEAWNPFVPTESTERPISRTFKVDLPDGTKHVVQLNAFVLPNKHEYSTREALARARLRNNLQGFYVYREDRIIIAADWLGMYSQEPHMTLLRAELSFPRDLDEFFGLDIKKSQVHITVNPALYRMVQREIEPVRRIADRRYRQGRQKDIKDKGSPHEQSQSLIDSKYADTTEAVQVEQVGDNQVKITNANGTTVVSMPTVRTPGVKDLIEVVDSLDDGLFWAPALINGRLGVRINRSHPYYERVYVPNFNDTVTVQGIDSILWALAKCEEEVMHKDVRRKLTDLRYHVSHTLRELAEELPEVDTGETRAK